MRTMPDRFPGRALLVQRMNITTEQLFDNARTQNGFTAEPAGMLGWVLAAIVVLATLFFMLR